MNSHTFSQAYGMEEIVNVQGTDRYGSLVVKVYNPLPLDAVKRARLYQAAPEMLEALKECARSLDHGESIREQVQQALSKAEPTT